jgi:hypothetical protein
MDFLAIKIFHVVLLVVASHELTILLFDKLLIFDNFSKEKQEQLI